MTDSVLIKDKPVSLIPSRQDTLGGDTRYIEEINIVSRALEFEWAGRYVTSVDSLLIDITSLGDAIPVNDGRHLVIQSFHSEPDGVVQITPILEVEGTYAVSPRDIILLPTKESRMAGGVAFRSGASTYISPVFEPWDVLGALNVYIHVTALSSGNSINLRGGII